jgi:NAD(P)-dependent dehydrogenase (short-subunit alcohol dehydrogenase family)
MIIINHEEKAVDLGLGDKVALVTGASSGIGAAIARTLAAEGARVALGCHTGRDKAGRLADELGTAMVVSHDLADPPTIQAAAGEVAQNWGRLDILVTCAWAAPGWAPPDNPAEATAARAWQDQMRVNAEGTAFTVQAVLPHMRAAGWGRIVLLSSGAADGAPGLEHYAAAKAALHGLARSLARSAGKAGILTNIVMPGLIATERHRQSIPEQALDQIAESNPTGRLATEGDIAQVVAFLASAANNSVTGAEIHVGQGA